MTEVLRVHGAVDHARKKMVNNKVNDMFGTATKYREKCVFGREYANAVGQLSDANDRAAHAEHDLQVERITRQGLIDEEVARRVAEAEERIRKELEAQLADKTKNWRNVIRLWISVSLM